MAEMRIERATAAEATQLAHLAAATFPLACPPGTDPADIADFVGRELSSAAFAAKLADPHWLCLVAWRGGELVGYTLTGFGPHAEDGLDDAAGDGPGPGRPRPTCLLSKCYVLPAEHGGAVAGALMARTLAEAARRGARSCWLGVNQLNVRAQRFYAKHGFVVVGERDFTVGRQNHHDFVLQASLPPAPPPAVATSAAP